MISPLTFLRRFALIFGPDDARNLYTVPKFARAHKDMLIIIADPHTDRIFVTQNGRFVNSRIRSSKGRASHVVRDMLKKSQFKQDALDGFITSVAEALKLSLPNGNQFYQVIDGAIFNLAKQASADRRAKKQKKGALADRPPASRSIPTPYAEAVGRPSGDT